MYQELVHIYGPFSIQSFGVMIALGLIIFVWLAGRHPLRTNYMSFDSFMDLIIVGIMSGIIGGRLLYCFTEWGSLNHWYDVFSVWEGGLSLLGTVIACGITLPLYLHYKTIPVLPTLDLVGLYAPLLQGISRIGCFLAGCCYGKPMINNFLCLQFHPTQLYSAALLITIFFILRYFYKTKVVHQGQPFALYLMLTSSERFFVDFFRGDREFIVNEFLSVLSLHQWISLLLFGIGVIVYIKSMQNSIYSRRI